MALFNYKCDEVKHIIDEVSPNYPQLTTYEKEWLYFHKYGYIPGTPVELEYEVVNVNPTGMITNAIPYQYKSAILKGNTKYRDIDTGDILDTFDETKNLELVSVKMPVLMTTGKNIVGNLEKGSIGSNGENVNNANDSLNTRTDFILLKKDTTYSFSSNGTKRSFHLYLYDLNKNFKTRIGMRNEYTPDASCYIRLFQGDNINNALYQVEEGTIATPYEPYKSNILTVNEDVVLRGIDDVQDTLDLMKGEVTECISEIVLDGSQDGGYEYATDESLGILTLRLPKIPDIINTGANVYGLLSDKYDSITSRNPDNILSYNGRIIITKSLSELESFDTVDKIKSFLSQNPITVQYPLATPVVKTVDLTPLNKPYEGLNHYELTSNIPCEAILEVPVVSTGKQTLEEINN